MLHALDPDFDLTGGTPPPYVILADQATMPKPKPKPKRKEEESCEPQKTDDVRTVYLLLDENEYPPTDDPDAVSEFWPAAPVGETVTASKPKVLSKTSHVGGLKVLLMVFKFVMKRKRKCPDGSEVVDEHRVYILLLIIWVPTARGRFAAMLIDYLKRVGQGPDPSWKNNAFVYVGHAPFSNNIPWKAVAETGRFSGTMDDSGAPDPNGKYWDTRMCDLSCFGGMEGRDSPPYAYHTTGLGTYMPADKIVFGKVTSGDVRGAQKWWNNNKPAVLVVGGKRLKPARILSPTS